MRHKQSEYMHWAKTQSRARFNLATSGVGAFPLGELGGLIGGWSLSGGSDCSGCRRRVSDARRRAMLPALVSAAPAAVFHAARLAGVSIKTMKSVPDSHAVPSGGR